MERTPEGWSRELKNGVYVLTRTFQFGDFAKRWSLLCVLVPPLMMRTIIRKLL